MERNGALKISEGVSWTGVKDPGRRIFDALIPLPEGTSYNAYLVQGKEKTALIDTVNPGFEQDLEDKIAAITNLENLDYIVMNHAEPDHAGSIPYFIKANKKALLVTTKKGKKMASSFYHVPEGRMRTVEDGDEIELGGKTLRFIEAPWLHWPETMFTYLVQNKILFPCDFFGAHTASGVFDEDVKDVISMAKTYFGEIMMPFRNLGRKALDKLEGMDIEMIAPSHGPIYKNPKKIIEAYRRWTAGETKEKVILVYVSMWKSTEAMVKTLAEALEAEGIEVNLYDLSQANLGGIAKDLVDSRAVVLGTPTVLGGMHPLAVYAAYLIKTLRPPLKYGVVIGSYGWGGGALRQAKEILGQTTIELVGSLEVHGPPSAADNQKITEIAGVLVSKVWLDEHKSS